MKWIVTLPVVLSFLGCRSVQTEVSATVTSTQTLLSLDQALAQSKETTFEYLRSQVTETPYDGILSYQPLQHVPPQLLKTRTIQTVSNEKKEMRLSLKKYRSWNLKRKLAESEKLIADFSCEKVIPTQALAMMMETDFPEQTAIDSAMQMHEKVLTCPEYASQESRFRLSAFLIQAGKCDQASAYLKGIPTNSEQGVLDRATFMGTLCGEKPMAVKINPLGGYGVLILGPHIQLNDKAPWFLSAQSGDQEWDRLFASLLELAMQDKKASFQHVVSRLNTESFKTLPVTFKASLWYLMYASGTDLNVFQTLHPYLTENPNMISAGSVQLLFPVRYWQEIVAAAQRVDPVLVKSLVRQESAFNPQARSQAKAMGLMQLIYSTARIFGVSKKAELSKPEVNLTAGSKFLASLIQDFGSPELALAAYNAGPNMVRQWKKRYPTDNLDLFVEMIPYAETREYVRLVNRNYQVYQNLLVKPQIIGQLPK